MKKTLLTVSIGTVLFCACKKDNNNSLNSTDQNFMTQVAIGNNAEIQAGQLAATKSSNSAVQAFGQMMVMEHGQAQTDLKTLGSKVGRTISDTVDATHKQLMTTLSNLSGDNFDTAYINSQIRDHQNTLNVFQTEINSGNQSDVKAYASKYLSHIQEHLRMADSVSLLIH